jgi:glycine cleavage system H protein
VNVPTELRYTKEHEWVRLDNKVATVGITDYAQGELGDIVFVELADVGSEVVQMEAFGTIEAVKAVSEIYSPLTGKVTEVNSVLDDDPMIINRDPYGDGWMMKIEIGDPSQIEQLLDASGYEGIIE